MSSSLSCRMFKSSSSCIATSGMASNKIPASRRIRFCIAASFHANSGLSPLPPALQATRDPSVCARGIRFSARAMASPPLPSSTLVQILAPGRMDAAACDEGAPTAGEPSARCSCRLLVGPPSQGCCWPLQIHHLIHSTRCGLSNCATYCSGDAPAWSSTSRCAPRWTSDLRLALLPAMAATWQGVLPRLSQDWTSWPQAARERTSVAVPRTAAACICEPKASTSCSAVTLSGLTGRGSSQCVGRRQWSVPPFALARLGMAQSARPHFVSPTAYSVPHMAPEFHVLAESESGPRERAS